MRRENKNVAVIFLLRNDCYYQENLTRFLSSYKHFQASNDHNLYVVLKGFGLEAAPADIKDKLDEFNVVKVLDEGLDIHTYQLVATKVYEEWVVFFNSYSEFLVKNPITILRAAASENGSSLVGCTASLEALRFSLPFFPTGNIRYLFKFLKKFMGRLWKSYLWANVGVTFPNPHVRTNGFLTKRRLFLSYFQQHKVPFTRRECLLFESGKISYTNFVMESGGNPGVVDRRGVFFDLGTIGCSKVFRKSAKNSCLILDNRTREFIDATGYNKLSLEWDAWRQ